MAGVQLSYDIYDTAVLTNGTAPIELTLFQIAQNGDATHTESFTNARGGGSFPSGEGFTVESIHVFADFNGVIADMQNMWIGSLLELRVRDLTIIKAPLITFVNYQEWGVFYTQAAAAAEAVGGPRGAGRTLMNPVNIPGGTSFKVRVVQGTTLSVATSNVKVVLRGTLDLG